MMERAEQYKHILRGWKTYCAWGDVPNASGWFLDTDTGQAFLEQVVNVSNKHKKIPPVVATHKGFALPGFDQRAATPRDVGPAAKQNRGRALPRLPLGLRHRRRPEALPRRRRRPTRTRTRSTR